MTADATDPGWTDATMVALARDPLLVPLWAALTTDAGRDHVTRMGWGGQWEMLPPMLALADALRAAWRRMASGRPFPADVFTLSPIGYERQHAVATGVCVLCDVPVLAHVDIGALCDTDASLHRNRDVDDDRPGIAHRG